MMRAVFSGVLVLSLLTGTVSNAAASGEPPTEQRAKELGRTYTRQFYEGPLDRVSEHFSPAMERTVGGLDGLRQLKHRVRMQIGVEKRVREERVIPWLGSSIYHRRAIFSGTDQAIGVQWTVESSGEIEGFFIRPVPQPAPSRYADYRTRASLRLPFDGEWFVYWGGRAPIENYHVIDREERFAYDFVIEHDGSTHENKGSANEDYFCFGEPILAPADARVVTVREDIEDNIPGVLSTKKPLGNYLILSLGRGEFAFLAHLRQHSIEVEPHARVRAGALLGRCGNSGRSSEPHLHFHLQTAPKLTNGAGLPAQFRDYLADGERVARGEPRRGQSIARAP